MKWRRSRIKQFTEKKWIEWCWRGPGNECVSSERKWAEGNRNVFAFLSTRSSSSPERRLAFIFWQKPVSAISHGIAFLTVLQLHLYLRDLCWFLFVLVLQLLEISSCVPGAIIQQKWLMFYTGNILVVLKALIFCAHMLLFWFFLRIMSATLIQSFFFSVPVCHIFSPESSLQYLNPRQNTFFWNTLIF